MTPYVQDADFTLWLGDVREVLPTLEAESVDCALTSPPFFGLRDYSTGQWQGGDANHEHDTIGARGGKGGSGTLDKRSGNAMVSRIPARICSCGAEYHDRQIGLEATPDEWVAELVTVFRELRRVLKPAGTLWVECGDSYASTAPGTTNAPQTKGSRTDPGQWANYRPRLSGGLKPKDLIGAPWQLAFALRADGWYLRQCIVWHKPNAMPESVRDRCTTAHSYVFLLSKQPRYWFDADAISEPAEWARWGDQTVPKYEGTETASGWMQPKTKAELIARGGRTTNGQRERSTEMRGFDNRLDRADGQKNARSVWTIPTQGFPEAHFATWPEALVERIIKAGCPEWVCAVCGKPRERIVERAQSTRKGSTSSGWREASRRGEPAAVARVGEITIETRGWSDCGHGNYRPGVVLDPFMGSGTTALVARRLGRRSVGVELNADYCQMAARRLSQLSLLAEGAA